MHRSGIFFVVEILFAVAVSSVVDLDVTSSGLFGATMKPDMASSLVAAVTSRHDLVHCEISVTGAREMTTAVEPFDVTAPTTTVSGFGCKDPDTVTSLTLKILAHDDGDDSLLPVDQLSICRFANVERIAIVGGPLNESSWAMTSLNCFRYVRHVIVKSADIDVIRPWLIHYGFRWSRDLRFVGVTAKPTRYVTSHPDELNLAILPWVGSITSIGG